MKKIIFVFWISILAVNQLKAQISVKKFVPFNDKHQRYMGRVGYTDSCAQFFWTGTNVSINVKNTKNVNALISDTHDENYYYVIVDGKQSEARKIRIDKAKKSYPLATNLSEGTHHILLYKITNTDHHTTNFFGFEIDKDAKVLRADKPLKRKMEFFGNSITTGHGVDVPEGGKDSGAAEFHNNYKTYDAITARHFNAQYHVTAKSGIGIMVSWFKEIMPDIYDLLDPKNLNSKWNFSKYKPDIVVVNLFQNDSYLVTLPEHEQYKARFGTQKPTEDFYITSYINFIRSVRVKYPKAQIICCLGSMGAVKPGSKWPGYIDEAVNRLKDDKIVTHFFAYKGSDDHPKIKAQQAMANSLIKFIEEKGYFK